MAEDPKKEKKKPAAPKREVPTSSGKEAAPPSASGGAPPGSGGAPAPGGLPGMSPPTPNLGASPMDGAMPAPGAMPPMPGSGIDPYAALMGQISAGPPPSGFGGGGSPMGGGMSGGMGQTQGDPMTAALMSDINPAAGGQPDLGQNWQQGTPGGAPAPQQGIDLQSLIQMLALMQGGIPNSGLTPPGPSSSGISGISGAPALGGGAM